MKKARVQPELGLAWADLGCTRLDLAWDGLCRPGFTGLGWSAVGVAEKDAG